MAQTPKYVSFAELGMTNQAIAERIRLRVVHHRTGNE